MSSTQILVKNASISSFKYVKRQRLLETLHLIENPSILASSISSPPINQLSNLLDLPFNDRAKIPNIFNSLYLILSLPEMTTLEDIKILFRQNIDETSGIDLTTKFYAAAIFNPPRFQAFSSHFGTRMSERSRSGHTIRGGTNTGNMRVDFGSLYIITASYESGWNPQQFLKIRILLNHGSVTRPTHSRPVKCVLLTN